MKRKKRVSRSLAFERLFRPKLTSGQHKDNNSQNTRQNLLGDDDGLLEGAADGAGVGLLLGDDDGLLEGILVCCKINLLQNTASAKSR
jgi:hypothetical protein